MPMTPRIIVTLTRQHTVALIGVGVAAAPLAAQVVAFPEPSDAAPVYHYVVGRDGRATLEDPASRYRNGPSPQSAVEVYDNFRRPDYDPPGNTLIRGRLRTGGHEVGDDMFLDHFEGGLLDSSGFTIANMSDGETLTAVRIAFRFYEEDQVSLLGEFVVGLELGFPLPPRSAGTYRWSEGSLLDLRIPIQSEMYHSIQFSDAEGAPLADLGQLFGGPPNTGTSSRFVRDFTAGQAIDLGDEPLNNLFMFVRSSPIPGIGGDSVWFCACIGVARRRRR